MARIYSESLKKWATGVGITGSAGIVFLLFSFLITADLIEPISFSGDQSCAGTIEDPCYAEMTFKVKEDLMNNNDIFIYPIGYDPWGRNTTFDFYPGLKDWKLQRSWGSGWRTYDLTKPCTGTWCGLSNSADTRKFSLVWREGKTYTIRIVGYKNSPEDTIKWSAFDDIIDPTWYPPATITSLSLVEKEEGYMKYWNTTKDIKVWNDKCEPWYEKNKSFAGCWEVDYVEVTQHEEYIVTKEWQEVLVNNKIMDVTAIDWWCYEDKSCTICKDKAHGDGDLKIKGIKQGQSYCISCDGGDFECSGYHKFMIPSKVVEVLK